MKIPVKLVLKVNKIMIIKATQSHFSNLLNVMWRIMK